MSDSAYDEIIQKIKEKMAEKDEIIGQLMAQVNEKDVKIEELQAKLKESEAGAKQHEDLLAKLREVID